MSELEKSKKILKCWYNMEYFKPFFPKLKKEDSVFSGNIKQDLPWINGKENEIYHAYIGKIKVENLIKKLHVAINLGDSIEEENLFTCVGKIKFNHKGEYVKDSFEVNPFLIAVTTIINTKSFDIEINEEIISNFNNKVDAILEVGYPVVNEEEKLKEIEDLILSQLDYLNNDNFYCLIRTFSDGEIDIDENMIDSLFIKDISMVFNNIKSDDKIINYITGNELINRLNLPINKDIDEMKKCTFPNKYPMGKWPSKNSPSIREQIGINVAISEERIFSVDSSIGIRKQVLLRELIADSIVNRAIELSKYEEPNNAFSMRKLKKPTSDFFKTYYEFPAELEKYSIVVASNNNLKAQSISLDLQNANNVVGSKTHTGSFDINYLGEIYFSDLATKLTGESAWGLISVPLGNESNIKELKSILNTNKNQPFGRYFNDESKMIHWNIARESFIAQYKKVKNYEAGIIADVKRVYDLDNKIEELTKIQNEQFKINKEIDEKHHSIEEISKMEKENIVETQLVCESIINIENDPSFFTKLALRMFKNSKVNKELNNLKEKREKLEIRYSELKTLKADIEVEIPKDINKLKDNEEMYSTLKMDYDNEVKIVEAIQNKYKTSNGNNFVDSEFFENIGDDNKSQNVCPWTNEEYDGLREELFYRALILQKSFVQNANGVKQNIRMLCKAWEGNKFAESDMKEFYKHILNTLFLVIPVVTTNFDFAQTLLEYIGKEELGTLIIDEDGQVEPRFAIGTLWRTRKSIVGDILPTDESHVDLSKVFIK